MRLKKTNDLDELYKKMENELKELMSIRTNLDNVLNDMNHYIKVVVFLEKRITEIEKKIDELPTNEKINHVNMYG